MKGHYQRYLAEFKYLDRFLCGFQSHNGKPWMTQLAAVACLSLSAKVEETQVPLLLGFQVEDSKNVFKAYSKNGDFSPVYTAVEDESSDPTFISRSHCKGAGIEEQFVL